MELLKCIPNNIPWSGLNTELDCVTSFEDVFIAVRNKDKPFSIEKVEGVKQLATYTVVRNGETGAFLVYARDKGDPRLSSKLSLGFGGHVEATDEDVIAATYRELKEELQYEVKSITFIGHMNDNSDPVGRCHYGIVSEIEIADDLKAIVPESPVNWFSLTELLNHYPNFESWSKRLIEHYLTLRND